MLIFYSVILHTIPADDPLVSLEAAARRLDSAKHHPNCVGVQFVQIGDDQGAKEALELLTRGSVRVRDLSKLCAIKKHANKHIY